MSAPEIVPELGESEILTGPGPHDVPTNIAAPDAFRGAAPLLVIVANGATNDILYVESFRVVRASAAVLSQVSSGVWYASPGWAGTVTIVVSIVDDEFVGTVECTALGPTDTIRVTYRAEGVKT